MHATGDKAHTIHSHPIGVICGNDIFPPFTKLSTLLITTSLSHGQHYSLMLMNLIIVIREYPYCFALVDQSANLLMHPYRLLPFKVEHRAWKMRAAKRVSAQEKPTRKAIIKQGQTATDYFEYCDEVGCDIWGLLLSMCPQGKNQHVCGFPSICARALPNTCKA